MQTCLRQRAGYHRPRHPSPIYLTCSRPAKSFHTSTPRRDESALPNHYATLDLAPNASPSDVKKQFYKLSKSHHPDLHPNDPTAPQRFVRISEAYATLGSVENRQRYDRDFQRSSHAASQTPTGTSSAFRPKGSYSSASTPFGGRPASGLSRRRTQFRGPPPSFYSSGGWGGQSAKRAQAASESSHTAEAQGQTHANTGTSPDPNAQPGTGPAGASAGFDVPHFNASAHAQTQTRLEQSRHKTRREVTRERMEEADSERGAGGGLFQAAWVGALVLGIYFLSASGVGESSLSRRTKSADKEGG